MTATQIILEEFTRALTACREYPPDITADTSFDDIDLSDLERASASVNIETRLLVEFSDAEVSAWLTVADVIACVALCARRAA